MALVKQELSKELVVNVLQQEDGKEGETVQIRIESNTMGSEVDLEEESQPVDEVEEVHENVVMSDMTYDERFSEMEEVKPAANQSRYLKYRQRWRNSWLEIPEFQGWLTRNEQTRNAHCVMCKRDIRGSLTMIRRHALTGKHIDNVTNFGALVARPSGKLAAPNFRYVSDSNVASSHGEQVILVSPMEGGQTGTVFVNQDDTNVDGEAFNGVIGEEEYSPVDSGEVYATIQRTEQFSASHRLHSNELTTFKNQEIFGKCNNINGHGHNYKMVVALTGPIEKTTGMVMNMAELKRAIKSNVLDLLDHKNIDQDVPYFRNLVSTVENIAVFIWRQLRPVIDQKLHIRVTVHETDKNTATFPASI